MTKHINWPSITSFHNVRKSTATYPHILNGNHKVTYRGKCKLHGTNSGIQFTGDDVVAQSRTTILKDGADNAGFAAWVNEHKEAFLKENQHLKGYTIFGEWIGPGINKGCAVHLIDNKSFAVFAMIKRNPAFTEDVMEVQEYDFIADPAIIKGHLLGLLDSVPNIFILPWHTEEVEIDWNSSGEDLKPVVEGLNAAVNLVEACDPWVKETFGKEGVGEGIVYYPRSRGHMGRDNFSNLGFKAKGEKHKIVKAKAAVTIDPAVAASVVEFVDMVVTDARLDQGVQEACGGEYDIKKVGPFIGWISKDCAKECQDELKASGLEWKQVSKDVARKARTWYIGKTEEL